MPTHNAATYNLRCSPKTMRKLNSIARQRGVTVRELMQDALKLITGVSDEHFFQTYTRKPKTKKETP